MYMGLLQNSGKDRPAVIQTYGSVWITCVLVSIGGMDRPVGSGYGSGLYILTRSYIYILLQVYIYIIYTYVYIYNYIYIHVHHNPHCLMASFLWISWSKLPPIPVPLDLDPDWRRSPRHWRESQRQVSVTTGGPTPTIWLIYGCSMVNDG